MASWALIGIAASIAVIATAVSVVAAILLHWPSEIAAIVGLLVFVALGLVQLLLGRGDDMPSDDARLDALEQTMGDLLDRVEAVTQRQRGADNALIERVRTATEPLVQEIAALSGRLGQLEEGAEEAAEQPQRPAVPRPQPMPAMPQMPRAASLPVPTSAAPPTLPAPPPARPEPPPAARPEVSAVPRPEVSAPPARPPVTQPPVPPAAPPTVRPEPPRRPEPQPIARADSPPPVRPETPAPVRPEPPRPEPPRPEPPRLPDPVRPPEPPRPEKTAPPAPAPKVFDSLFQIPKRPDAPLPIRPAGKRSAAPIPRQSAAPDPADLERAALVREALAGGRHEPYLVQIVRLPSRRLSHYEAVIRLRDARNAAIEAPEIFAAAERSGLAPDLDRVGFEAAALLLRRLAAGNRATGALVPISPASLAEGSMMTRLADLATAAPILAERLVLQMPQGAWAALPPTEADKVAALVEIGFRFSIDRLTHMRLDGRELARRGVRFVKLPAALLLDPKAAATSPMHPNDLAGLLERNGVTLVVDQVEQEATVASLLEIGVKFAQGPIFGEPRPLRIEVPAEADEDEPPPAAPPSPVMPKGGRAGKAGGTRPPGTKRA